MLRNSSFDSMKRKSSSPSPSVLPLEPAPPPSPPSGRGMRSPFRYSLLPGSTYSRTPPSRPWWNDGSRRSSAGMAIFSPSPTSAMPRPRTTSRIASWMWRRARRRKRCRLLRLLPFGFRRRSMMFKIACLPPSFARGPLPGLLDAHVPLDEAPHLALGISALHHPRHELGVLLLGLGILLRAEADHRQQVLDLAEHPPLDHLAQLLVRRPGRVLAVVLGACPQRELHDLVAEVLRVGDAGWLLDLRE